MEMLKNEEIILKKGMDCLSQNLGVLEIEIFISILLRNAYDYTQWRQGYFADAYKNGGGSQLENFLSAAAKNDPYAKSFGITENV